MSQAKPSTRLPKLRDPLRYWLDQEAEPIAEPLATPPRMVSGWWIIPLVGSGAFLWMMLFWTMFD